MLKLVPTVKTPISVNDFTRAFIKAWHNIYKAYPNKSSIAVLYSQWGTETGPGTYCWGSNIGNSKAIDDKNPNTIIKYQMLANTWEIINGKKVIFQPPHPATWFRAFDTLEEGVEHHLDLLRNKRYRIAWPAVEQGDHIKFVTLLKQQGYFTATLEAYIKLSSVHYKKYMQLNVFEEALLDIRKENEPKEQPVTPPIVEPAAEVIVPKADPPPPQVKESLLSNLWKKISERKFW